MKEKFYYAKNVIQILPIVNFDIQIIFIIITKA